MIDTVFVLEMRFKRFAGNNTYLVDHLKSCGIETLAHILSCGPNPFIAPLAGNLACEAKYIDIILNNLNLP